MGLPAVGCASLLLLSECWGDERAKISTPSSAKPRAEAAASRVELASSPTSRFELHLLKLESTYLYAIFAIESPDPGRRLSSAQPAPPTARHIRGMTVNEGSTPRHAAVCSAMVKGIL